MVIELLSVSSSEVDVSFAHDIFVLCCLIMNYNLNTFLFEFSSVVYFSHVSRKSEDKNTLILVGFQRLLSFQLLKEHNQILHLPKLPYQ